MDLKNKVVIITGASRGIGRAVALEFANQKANVVVSARTISELHIIEKNITSQGANCLAIKCDVTKKNEVDSLAKSCFERFGTIDILVNNAGMGIYGMVHEVSEQDFDTMVNINFKGVFLCTKSVLPFMMNQQSGHIITVSSVAAKKPIPNMAVYCGTKYALEGFCKTLAKEVKSHNIRVSMIYPGMVNSHFRDGMKNRSPYSEGQKSMMIQNKDIARSITFIAQQEPNALIEELEITAPMF